MCGAGSSFLSLLPGKGFFADQACTLGRLLTGRLAEPIRTSRSFLSARLRGIKSSAQADIVRQLRTSRASDVTQTKGLAEQRAATPGLISGRVRQSIISAARALFAEKGYSGATVDEIVVKMLWGGGRRGLWHSRRSVQRHQWSAPCRNLLMRAGPSPPSSRIARSSPQSRSLNRNGW